MVAVAVTPPKPYWVAGLVSLGIYLLSAVVFTVMVQLIGTKQDGIKWSKPYFESYLYHAFWVIATPLAYLIYWIERRRHKTFPPLPYRRLAVWGVVGGPAVVINSYFYFMMEARLTLSVASAIVQCYFLIIFVLCIIFLRERITLVKVVASAVCVGGVALATVSGFDTASGSTLIGTPAVGYLFLAGSMLIAAVYQVAWAYIMAPVKAAFGPSVVLGFFGLASAGIFTALVMWVGVLIGHLTGLEPFELPPEGPALNGVLLTMGMDFLLNLTNLLAIGFINPTFVTVGGLLLIPLNILAQFVLFRTLPDAYGWAGVAVIIFGCALFETGDLIRARCWPSEPVKFLTEQNEELYQAEEEAGEEAPLLAVN